MEEQQQEVEKTDGRMCIKDLSLVDTKGFMPVIERNEAGEEVVAMLPSVGHDLIVMARTPAQLDQSREQVKDWLQLKLRSLRAAEQNAQENLDAAIQAKVKTSAWKAVIYRERRRIKYYEKLYAALEAGYYIVPDFPINVIAVRTKKTRPTVGGTEYRWASDVRDEPHQFLPVGEGEYVNPDIAAYPVQRNVQNSEGKTESVTRHQAAFEFDEIDFPLRVIRPQILKDFSKAVQAKIFDEIGVLPDTRRRQDPVVVGRIELKEGYTRKSCSFIISWWIPTSSL
jgi:hypothetical protein